MKRLLLSATAIAMLAAPAVGLAQPDQGQARDHRSAQTEARPASRATERPSYRPAYQNAPRTQFRESAPSPSYPPREAYRQAPRYVPEQRSAPQRQVAPRPYSQPALNRQDQWRDRQASTRDGRWDRQGQESFQSRDANRDRGEGWNRNAGAGRERGDWWSGRRGFEGYEGRRNGYWYAPGWGYYRPSAAWYGYSWSIGAFVPYGLRSYYVDDPYEYGLPPAPYGYRWIFLDNRLVMIDLRTGYIVQIADTY